jgi:hypothetical protein
MAFAIHLRKTGLISSIMNPCASVKALFKWAAGWREAAESVSEGFVEREHS